MTEPLPPTDDLDEVERRLRMPLVDAMVTQRSIRRILPDPVAPAIVRRLIELGLEGPTGSNGQNWEFVVVTDPGPKAVLAKQYRRAWKIYGGLGQRLRKDDQTTRILKSVKWQVDHFEEVPVMVVACLKNGPRPPVIPVPAIADSSHYGSIYPSVQNLLLGARAIGLGASARHPPPLVEHRGAPGAGPPRVGRPHQRHLPRVAHRQVRAQPRRPVDEVLHLERWGGS